MDDVEEEGMEVVIIGEDEKMEALERGGVYEELDVRIS